MSSLVRQFGNPQAVSPEITIASRFREMSHHRLGSLSQPPSCSLLKRLARLHRDRIKVRDPVVGSGSDPDSPRSVAVAAEGDAVVIETDRQAVTARQFVDLDAAAVAIDDAFYGIFPKAIATDRQRAVVGAAL